jgi:hypothetical protein
MSHLPRNGQYELFMFRGVVRCFDDPSIDAIPITAEMDDWLKAQPIEVCRPYPNDVGSNPSAWYLSPEMYLIWKLKWS